MTARWRGEHISAPKNHVTRRPAMKTFFPLNLFLFDLIFRFQIYYRWWTKYLALFKTEGVP